MLKQVEQLLQTWETQHLVFTVAESRVCGGVPVVFNLVGDCSGLEVYSPKCTLRTASSDVIAVLEQQVPMWYIASCSIHMRLCTSSSL